MNKTKKYLIILLFFIGMLFSLEIVSNAASASISASTTNPAPGQTVTVTGNVTAGAWNLQLSGAGKSETIYGFTNKNGNSSASKSITFTAGNAGQEYVFSLSGGMTDINANNEESVNKSVRIKVANNSSSTNNNSSNNSSTSNNGSTNNSGKTVKMITTSPKFTGKFNTGTKKYYIKAGKDVQQLKVTVEYIEGKTKTYTKNLESGQRSYTFDGYQIIVTKDSEEGEVIPNEIDEETTEQKDEQKQKLRLDNLVLDDNLNAKLDPNFDSEVFEYTVILGNDYLDLKELYINALPNIDGAKVTIEGNKELTDGETTVTIKVEAEGYETVTYTIKVVKQEIVETEAEPVLEETDDFLDNSKELMKKRRIICSLVCLITIIGIIFIAKECYESTNNLEENYYDEDEDDEYDEEYINSKYEYPEEENNILEDLYKIKNNDTETHNTPFLREEQNNIENNNNEKIENTETKMDEFFSKNTRIEFSEGRTRRKHKKGKHS